MKIYVAYYGPYMKDDIEKLKQNNNEVIILTEGSVNIFSVDKLVYEIEEKMKNTNISKEDYLLLGGNSVSNGIANIVMYDLVGRVNYLIYDAKTKSYIKRDNIKEKKQ
jgi:hypothetical protein